MTGDRELERQMRAARDAPLVNAWLNGASTDALAREVGLSVERVRTILLAREGVAEERRRRRGKAPKAVKADGKRRRGDTSSPS